MTLDTLLIISTLAVTGGILLLEMVQTFQLTRLGRVLRKLRINVTTGPPVSAATTTETPELPALPHKITCTRCGHEKETHLPFDAAQCFFDGCKCKGWKRK